MRPRSYDLAIIGSGFGGSLLAMIARRLGLSVILLERTRHPRFAIGESTTPLTNLLLEESARRFDLPRLLPLCKWGSWQTTHPEIACGLKRGFTFYHHEFGKKFRDDPMRRDQLMVAASPHDGIADTHWYRPDFDMFLMEEARTLGAEYVDEVFLDAPVWKDGEVLLQGQRKTQPVSLHARFMVDATGPRGYLHRALNLNELPFEHLPATQGLYTHFTGVQRWESGSTGESGDSLPYPPDDAALHHVFDGGWIWVLRFNNGVTSAGVAAADGLAKELGFAEGAPAWDRLLKRLPSVAEQFAQAKACFPFMHAPRLSFRSEAITGPGWAMLPFAAGFVDPLLSTGFPLTLMGVRRLAEVLACGDWSGPDFGAKLQRHEEQTREELLAAERMVAALYANMGDFETFSAVSLLYFAAVSYSETARRLGKPELADSFLLRNHPVFGPQFRQCLDEVRKKYSGQAKADLLRRIREAVEPVDVAGLGNPDRHNRHPVDPDDLYRAAGKLKAEETEINALLERCGFYPSPRAPLPR